MTNCTITIDVTAFGYTHLLQLDSMLGDFLEDDDNAAAADTLHEWMLENARNFTDDARAAGDNLAADIFSDLAAANEDPEPEPDPATADEEEPATAPIYPGYTEALVQAWRNDNENRNLDAALGANATDTNNSPGNLYRAGVFAGLAEAAAWAIYNGSEVDDIEAIKEAVYRAYNVAW